MPCTVTVREMTLVILGAPFAPGLAPPFWIAPICRFETIQRARSVGSIPLA